MTFAFLLGSDQYDAVCMYCLDPAHDGAFLGRVVPSRVEGMGSLLVDAEHIDVVFDWLTDACNSLDDESRELDRDADDRRIARRWRDALQGLTRRLRLAKSRAAYLAGDHSHGLDDTASCGRKVAKENEQTDQ